MSVSTAPVCYGRCAECGGEQVVTAGQLGDLPDFGETYDNRYCCVDCLDAHGPTEHTRVRRAEVSDE